jgi:hypothetical protein
VAEKGQGREAKHMRYVSEMNIELVKTLKSPKKLEMKLWLHATIQIASIHACDCIKRLL